MRLLVFARAPVPGRVKRRLIPALGEEGAAALYRRLARACLTTAGAACAGGVELWCTPSVNHPFFAACAGEFGVSLHAQRGADLGERMAHALNLGLPAMVMGSDCPELTADDLRQAAGAIQRGADAVLGPARDGGYVLLGIRRADVDPFSSLFQGVPWGSASVLEETRCRLRRLGWRWHELPTRGDVDRPEDLAGFSLPP